MSSTADTGRGTPQQRLALACAEADRLQALADQEQARLRDARRARAAFERDSEQGLALSDPRRLAAAKQAAVAEYRENVRHATDRPTMLASTAAYLRELTRLNAVAKRGASGQSWSSRVRELDEQINRQHLNAEAARVAAESARAACVEARRAVVRQDEALAELAEADAMSATDGEWANQITAIEALLDGDRAVFQALVNRLAEEIGLDASRLQLLLLELRQALFERARSAGFLQFPVDNEFWAQFTKPEARAVASALDVLNRGFDGHGGWRGGHAAEPREMAIAVSMAGREPRLLRVRPTRDRLEALWRGTSVDPVEFVRERSPDLALETFEPLVGDKATALAELWDDWGRLRRLMLSPAAPA